MINGNLTCIYSNEGLLCFDDSFPLATKDEYESADRCVGSIFDEALQPGENIHLADGYFILNDDLDLIQDWQIV